jgi:hypothetical protein
MTFNPSADADFRRQLTTLIAIIGSIVVNTVSNIFPPNGLNVGTLSNTLLAPVQVTPANYAFAIWGLIYTGLIGFGIYQLQPSQRQNPRLQQSGYFLAIACVAQCAWIYLFLARLFILSVVAMFGILLSLIWLYRRLEIGRERVSQPERWFIQLPISIYLSWISVATIVNVASTLYIRDWNGWGIAPTGWTVMMMVVSAGIATVVVTQRHDIAYLLVTVWTLVAIAIRQIQTPPIAVAGVVLAIALILFTWSSETKSAIRVR